MRELLSRPPPSGGAGVEGRRWVGVAGTVVVVLLYVGGAFYVTGGLWGDLSLRTPAVNPQDHVFFQWVLAHGAQVVAHGANPFTTTAINVPNGVNLMANTSILGLGIPLAPITLLWGPQTSFALLLIIGLAGTAFGWYWVFSRHLVDNRMVAFAAGALCGFAPGMVSHAQGHVNWTAQFVVPWLVVAVLRIGKGHPVRRGVWLGLLVTYQAFVNEEVLLYTALGIGVLLLAYTLINRRAVRHRVLPFLGGVGTAGLVAAVLLAYPLWVQFFGPQSYHGVPTEVKDVSSDLAAYPAFARLSLAGSTEGAEGLTQGPAEENSFFGWPLLIICAAAVAVAWRRRVTWALLVTGVLFAALSLGPHVMIRQKDTGVDGPWRWLAELPIFNAVVPTRLSLVVVPVAAALLALGADTLLRSPTRRPVRIAVVTALLLAALVPIAPKPIPVADTAPTPPFVTDQIWRQYVRPGEAVVFVPVSTNIYLDGQLWSARAGLGFPIAGGYFLGPDDSGAGRAIFNAPTRFTGALFDQAARSGRVPPVTAETRFKFTDDLRFWRAGALVLPQTERNADTLRTLVTRLTGTPPVEAGGAWVWRVQPG